MSLPRYAKYKDSGAEWLGTVPSHWEVHPCRHLVVEQTEKNENAENQAYLSLMANVGIIPYEEKGDVGNKKPEDLSKCKLVSKGDLVINSMNYGIGSYGLSDLNGVCSPVYVVLRPLLDRVKARFAFRIFENKAFQTYAQSFGNGILEHRAAINWDILKCIRVGLPPIEEQEAILCFLDREIAKIDALIAEKERLMALLAEKRQATISRAITKGLNPNVHMKDSGVAWLGEMPADWGLVPLKYLVELRSGGTPSKDNLAYWGGNIPWASAKDLKVERLGGTIDCISQQAVDDGAASLVRAGAVLVVVRGMILARMFPVVETLVPMAINQDLKAVLPRERLSASFLAWLLRGSADESLQRLDEAGHGTKALRMDAWTSMQLPVPPLHEQVRIAAFLSDATARVDALCTDARLAIGLLKERRSALISAAVSGQIDVRGAVAAPTDIMKEQAA